MFALENVQVAFDDRLCTLNMVALYVFKAVRCFSANPQCIAGVITLIEVNGKGLAGKERAYIGIVMQKFDGVVIQLTRIQAKQIFALCWRKQAEREGWTCGGR